MKKRCRNMDEMGEDCMYDDGGTGVCRIARDKETCYDWRIHKDDDLKDLRTRLATATAALESATRRFAAIAGNADITGNHLIKLDAERGEKEATAALEKSS
jgi:hypothetical protein